MEERPVALREFRLQERRMLVRTLELQMSNLLHDGQVESVLLLGSLVASLNKPQEQLGTIYELYADALVAKQDIAHALRYYKLCLALECGHEVDIRLKIARCLHQLDDVPNALVMLKAIPGASRSLPVLMLLGKLYASQGLSQQAKLAYSAALKLNPYALEASFALAEMASTEQKHVDIQLPSSDAEWLGALFTTRECILTHRLPSALEAIEKVEKVFSSNVFCLLEKARVQMELEWTELSLNSFHKARQLDTANVMYMDLYAKLLKQCGLTTQLNNLVRDLLGINDNRPEPWLAAACYSDMKGDTTTALQLCDRAIAIDKGFARSHIYRGQLLFKLNRSEHAVAAFTAACKLEKSLDGYEGLVESYCDICLKGVDKYLDAMNVARLALLQAPKSPRSHILLGAVLSLRPENRDKARKTFEKALALNPDAMRAHFGLVDLWIHDGKYDQAIAKLLTLAQKQPRDVLYVKLGDVYTLNREYGNALPYYHRALSINPTLTKALHGLERVEKLMRGEDPDGALSTINGTIDDDDIESEYVDGNSRGVLSIAHFHFGIVMLVRLTLLVLAIGVAVHQYLELAQEPANTVFDEYFSPDYYHARQLFIENAQSAGAKVHTIPHPSSSLGLTIDIAILPGSDPSSLVIHLSGTHGVEGFAGSAIQSALLADKEFVASPREPTIAFVHAVNPYGFAKLRRVNENNVDLNRNYLSEEEFEAKMNQDPNHSGYMTLSDDLNPNTSVHWLDGFLPKMLGRLTTRGMDSIKSAVVSGTYHVEKGLFFGGHQLQASHQLLRDYFHTEWNLTDFKHVGLLDVHTGLGPKGYDTVQVSSPSTKVTSQVLKTLFPDHDAISDDTTEATALGGYDNACGFLTHGYMTWFNANTTNLLGVTQEFGTKHMIPVLLALRKENAATHYDYANRLVAAEELRDVFYLHWDSHWKYDVVNRGKILLTQLTQNIKQV